MFVVQLTVAVQNPLDPSDLVKGVKTGKITVKNTSALNPKTYFSDTNTYTSWPASIRGTAEPSTFTVKNTDTVSQVKIDVTGIMVEWVKPGFISANPIHTTKILLRA